MSTSGPTDPRGTASTVVGDVATWKGVKQAKDTASPIYTARVGIHHRLIFEADDGVLRAIDLVTRESLLTTLKRLRARR